jgi:hypothetical protein
LVVGAARRFTASETVWGRILPGRGGGTGSMDGMGALDDVETSSRFAMSSRLGASSRFGLAAVAGLAPTGGDCIRAGGGRLMASKTAAVVTMARSTADSKPAVCRLLRWSKPSQPRCQNERAGPPAGTAGVNTPLWSGAARAVPADHPRGRKTRRSMGGGGTCRRPRIHWRSLERMASLCSTGASSVRGGPTPRGPGRGVPSHKGLTTRPRYAGGPSCGACRR